MTTYPDMTPYEYGERDMGKTVLNVGWLGSGSQFVTGDVDPGFRRALLGAIANQEVNLTRGYHSCELCPSGGRGIRMPFDEARTLVLGHAEIHVEGADGVVYAAPTLIVHYIDVHDYRPPQQFIDAVVHAAEQDRGFRGR